MKRHDLDAVAERYSRRVYTFASYLLGDPGDAEDVTQEVLVKLWTHGGGIEADRLGAWLVQVTRNACIDVLRRRKRSAEVVALRPAGAGVPDHPSPTPSPERMAAGTQLGRKILDALYGLAEPARSIVILREILGLSYHEISEIMSIPVTTLKVTLYRARRRLRESLKEVRSHVAAG